MEKFAVPSLGIPKILPEYLGKICFRENNDGGRSCHEVSRFERGESEI